MTKGVKILIAVVIVIIIAGGVLLLIPRSSSNQSKTVTENEQTNGQNADVTITYDGTGFKLSTGTIKSGGTVKVENTSSKTLDLDSNPHPTHTDNTELNAGDVEAGKSIIFTLTAKGKWGFHNHLNSSQKGELTVE